MFDAVYTQARARDSTATSFLPSASPSHFLLSLHASSVSRSPRSPYNDRSARFGAARAVAQTLSRFWALPAPETERSFTFLLVRLHHGPLKRCVVSTRSANNVDIRTTALELPACGQ